MRGFASHFFSAYKLHVVEEKVYNDEEYNVFFLSLQGLYVSRVNAVVVAQSDFWRALYVARNSQDEIFQ